MTVILWILFCLLVGAIASHLGRSGLGWGVAACFCSPLLALIALTIVHLWSPVKPY